MIYKLNKNQKEELNTLFEDTKWVQKSKTVSRKTVVLNNITFEDLLKTCLDCNRSNPWTFVVNDHLWLKGMKEDPNEHICQDCFEKRIGRVIEIKDLKPCGWSRPIFKLLYSDGERTCDTCGEFDGDTGRCFSLAASSTYEGCNERFWVPRENVRLSNGDIGSILKARNQVAIPDDEYLSLISEIKGS